MHDALPGLGGNEEYSRAHVLEKVEALPVELLTRDMASVESSDEEQVEEQDEATAGGADGGANANEGAGGSAECSGAHTLTRVEVRRSDVRR